MNARLNSVREACRLLPEQRREEHIDDIMYFVNDVALFKKIQEDEVRSLCRTMDLETFAPRDFVFKIDDYGDKFYIVLTGSVSVIVPPREDCPNEIHEPGHCTCKGRGEDTVINLEPGTSFGEVALHSDAKRSASVQTLETTELLVTTRADYDRFAGKPHRLYIAQRVRFLRQFPKIEEALQRGVVNPKDIAAMANCLQERTLPGGELLLKQGDPVEFLTFVRTGSLAIVRVVDLDDLRGADGTEPERPESQGALASQPPVPNGQEGSALTTLLQHRWNNRSLLLQQPVQQLATAIFRLMNEERLRMQETGKPSWANKRVVQRILARGAFATGAALALEHQAFTEPADDSIESKKLFDRGQELWNRLRSAFRQARFLRKIGLGPEHQREETKDKPDQGQTNIQQMLDVSAARRRVAEVTSKALSEQRKAHRDQHRKAPTKQRVGRRQTGFDKPPGAAGAGTRSRKILLRIGTLSAYQYFGDRQVSHGEACPVSLVGDPLAEVYIISKYDIQRRFPRKLFAVMFSPDKHTFPSDAQILQLRKQNERWGEFRKQMRTPIASLSGSRQLTFAAVASSSDRSARFGSEDPRLKLELFGVRADDPIDAQEKDDGAHTACSLTTQDEVFYSHSNAAFIRKFDHIKRDRDVRRAFHKVGQSNRFRRRGSIDPSGGLGGGGRSDPNAFHFETRWGEIEHLSMVISGGGRGPDILENVMDDVRDASKTAASAPARRVTEAAPMAVVSPQSPEEGTEEEEESSSVHDAESYVSNVELPPLRSGGATPCSARPSRAASALGGGAAAGGRGCGLPTGMGAGGSLRSDDAGGVEGDAGLRPPSGLSVTRAVSMMGAGGGGGRSPSALGGDAGRLGAEVGLPPPRPPSRPSSRGSSSARRVLRVAGAF